MNRVLVTGAAGFIGSALCSGLMANHWEVNAAIRRFLCAVPQATRHIAIADINAHTDWQAALTAVDVVVHLAARVHVLDDKAADPLAAFRQINVGGTLNLARQAARAGVKRFVFISSIKVNGENTLPGQAFTADAMPAPADAYGLSKWEAEDGLRQLALDTDMEVVVIRPPLVYGPGVKANFRALLGFLHRGIPLPLARIVNKRSLIALDNLVDVIILCMTHPAAANQTFLVSDGEDIATPELLRRLAAALGKPARLLPVPVVVLNTLLFCLGKRGVAARLCGNLQVDISKTCARLAWVPKVSLNEALAETAQSYLTAR
ncbi:SDR family oxidoreductase [Methylovulum psychrotolerans]|uniref:UDP-glucose 4-epimerase family protein n=1 Tax=Methylovulum psychrotolerans TaxID=1704499 RepID=UPI001BFF40DD|nr:SDR family oxidoreductase [Methylovulum psychrotolerans]MBT9097228.1 SDR family oxidoreductase [Methylovulum psychrotolerans]